MTVLLEDVVAIIPLYNEASKLPSLLRILKQAGLKKIIFGVSPKSSDDTTAILSKENIPFVSPSEDGYDFAVEAALKKVNHLYPGSQVVLLSDVRHNYSYEGLQEFLDAINSGADMVMGIRSQKIKNSKWYDELGSKMILFPLQIFFKKHIRDISPFRMLRLDLIEQFRNQPKKFLSPSEVVVQSIAVNLAIIPLPVSLNQESLGDSV